jgi:hypothetical protein
VLGYKELIKREFCSVSNLLGRFESFWGVWNILGVFQINGRTVICILRCFVNSGVPLFLGGVLHIWATVILNHIYQLIMSEESF